MAAPTEETLPFPVEFSDDELEDLVEKAALYTCLCPSKVAGLLRRVRATYAYQLDCLVDDAENRATHETIVEALEACHQRLESCLEDVLTIEGWDRATLTMPDGLRQKILESSFPKK